ncbi:MAG: Fic family protein [Bacteroidales bacterium]
MKTFQSGRYIDHGCYKSFSPSFINRAWEMDDMELIELLSEASHQLGRLDMYFQYSKRDGDGESVEEVVKLLEQLPFSSRLIKEVHQLLGKEGRGNFKVPGTYRSSQSWACSLTGEEPDTFVPPYPTEIPELMSDLEKFANNLYVPLPDLVRVAIVYYQFITISPFWEGNEEMGRWLIPLYLMSMDVLQHPVLDMSYYFEKYADLYQEHLIRVRTHNDMTGWVTFFLEGVIEIARRITDRRAIQ